MTRKTTALYCVLFLSFAAAALASGPRALSHPATAPVPASAAAFFQSLHSLDAAAKVPVPTQGLDALLGQQSPTPATCHACFDPPLDCNQECTCGGSEFCMASGCSLCQCELCW
jgi:hypothetical protein